MNKNLAFLGTVLFGGILAAVPVEVLHCDFTRSAKETKLIRNGNTVERETGSHGWLLKFARAGRTDKLSIPYEEWKRPRTGKAILRVCNVKGSFAVRLAAIDGNGRWYFSGWERVDEKSSRIVFNLKNMPKGGNWCRFMYFSIDSATPGSQMLFERLDAVAERDADDLLQLLPDTKGKLTAAFDKTPSFIIRNGSDKHIRQKAEFTLKGMNGKEWKFAHSVNLAPKSECRFTPAVPPPAYGTYYGKAVRDTQRLMVAYAPYNGVKSPANKEFEFAMDNHWINPAVIEGLDFLGVRAIRSIVGWERIQPNSAKDWNFHRFDERIDALEKAGIKMRETLVFTPRWAAVDNPAKKPFPRNRKPKMEAWRNYVRAMMKRYGNRVEFFEIWNEPDLTGFWCFPVEDYIALCREAREIAREINPDIKIASGGMATLHPTLWKGVAAKFHEAVLKNASDTFDYHSYHEHGYFPHYQRMVDGHLLPLRKKYNITQPWLASETAIHSAKDTDVEQADCLFKKLLFTWARGGCSYTWYGLCNNGFDLDYSEDNFGIFDKFMHPKYVFGVYAALVRYYQTASFRKQIEDKQGWFFSFATPGNILLANWKVSNFGSNLIYAAGSSAKAASHVDSEGNASPLPLKDKIALFSVDSTGSTLLLENTRNIDTLAVAAELKLPNAVVVNQRTNGSVRVKNPWSKPVKCVIDPVETEGISYQGLPAEKILAPDEAVDLNFSLIAAARESNIKVRLRFDNLEPLELAAPVNFAVLAPNADFDNRKPDFILDKFNQVEHNFVFDPESAKRMWKNTDDLSARVYLGRDRELFRIRVIVKDDIHWVSNNGGDNIWMGDSIQFALQFPGQHGQFELGGGLTGEGKSTVAVWSVPYGFKIGSIRKSLQLDVVRKDGLLFYDFSIPLKDLRVNAQRLANGFKFNLLVNDRDDAEGRKCFIRITRGIGSNQTMKYSPLVICPQE